MSATDDLTRLFPQPAVSVPLRGCYLGAEVRPEGTSGLSFYANFVTSLDGRISIVDPDSAEEAVPSATANPRDWRLFQELAAHADVLITSGRYLRQFAAGTAQDVLPIGGGDDYADIREWRRARGLRPQPDVAVLSASLDFAVPDLLLRQRRRVHVFTGAGVPAVRGRRLVADGVTVTVMDDDGRVSGRAVQLALADLGYRRAYCVTGPRVLHTFVAAGLVDTLFVTTVHSLIGGEAFSTIVEGPSLSPPADYALTSLYLDNSGPRGGTQTFARYDRR